MGETKEAPLPGEASGVQAWPTAAELDARMGALAVRLSAMEGSASDADESIGYLSKDAQALRAAFDSTQAGESAWSPTSWALKPFSADRRVVVLAVPIGLIPGGFEALLCAGRPRSSVLDELVEKVRTDGKLTQAIGDGKTPATVQAAWLEHDMGELRVLLWHEKFEKVPYSQPAPVVRRRV